MSTKRLLSALVALGVAARVRSLFLPVTYDEAHTWLEYGRHGGFHVLSTYTHPNNHVLHSLMLAGFELSGPVLARLPALLAGLGLLAACAYLAQHLLGRGGLELAALLACSPLLITYSALSRGYMLGLLLLAVACVALSHERKYVCAALLAFATLAVPVFALPALLLLAWRREAAPAAAFAACAALLYSGILSTAPEALLANKYIAPSSELWFAPRVWIWLVPALCAAFVARSRSSLATAAVCCLLLAHGPHEPPGRVPEAREIALEALRTKRVPRLDFVTAEVVRYWALYELDR